MESHCLRLAELPRTTKLFSAFLDDFPRVAQFYRHEPNLEGVIASAKEVKFDPQVRSEVVAILRVQNRTLGSGSATDANLDRLANGAVAVVTGQQVGLFGSPAYSFYKALESIRTAERLSARGIEAVPVFWLATEDHDLAEVNHSFWLMKVGLERFEVETSPESVGRQVGAIRFGSEINGVVDAAGKRLEGPGVKEVERALREAYAPGENFGSAFGKLFARLLSKYGVILFDPLDPGLHHIAAPVFRGAIDEDASLRDALRARGKALEKAGFHTQVKVTGRSTLLFMNVDGKREPIRAAGDKFAAGGITISSGELLHAIDQTPELFSPNVLLRAIVQDTLLPTVAYIGGPAEIAYMAQVEVVYEKLMNRMPAILPRPGFTLVPPHVARLLKKYGVSLTDILQGRQRLGAILAAGSLTKGLARRFEQDEKTLQKALKGLEKPLGRLDKSLLGALATAERKMLYQFAKLRRKAGSTEGLRSGVLARQEQILLDSLFPQRALQERCLCLLPFIASFGTELLDELYKLTASPPEHHILYL